MNDNEFVQFLKSVLIKIENIINLLEQNIPKHIPAYNKALGVQQKLANLNKYRKSQMFSQLIMARGIVNYLMNGRYKDGYDQVLRLRRSLIKICFRIEKNERDKNK